MPLPAVSLAVVGIDYPNQRGPARRFDLALCKPGDPVQLIPEPKNKIDPNAIMVFSERGVQLGYIPAERALWIHKLAREGHEARPVFQELQAEIAVIRVAFDGADPVLPLVPAAPRSANRRWEEGDQRPAIEPEDLADYLPPDE